MYRLINEHADAVVKALDSIGDFREYLALREQLQSEAGNALQGEFQRSYRRYWRMNAARLNEDFYRRYFDLLAETQRSGEADVAAIANELARFASQDGLQFSFATKLAHMVKPAIPVYDSFVASFYFYTPPPATKPKGERLAELLRFHAFLTTEYQRISTQRLLEPAIKRMRRLRDLDESVPNERVIDWLIWSWVSLLRERAREGQTALFD